MSVLQLVSQNHLAVLLQEEQSQAPLARLPVYGELGVAVAQAPSYPISPEELPMQWDRPIPDYVRRNLVAHLPADAFAGLTPEQKGKLAERIGALLAKENELLPLFQHSDPELRALVEASVIKALADLGLPTEVPKSLQLLRSFPLGYVATDHVGYASFDLGRVLQAAQSFLAGLGPDTSAEFFIHLLPLGDERRRLDVLAQGRGSGESVFAKFSLPPPSGELDLRMLNLPSMQRPSLADWYLSPGSFAATPALLLGEDGTEELMPAQISLQEFNFRQVVRLPRSRDANATPAEFRDIPADYDYGYVDEYRANWLSLGHSLGEILYSLPLAPGESVKLAVIDWSWQSDTKRTEATALTEELTHQTHRERSIAETVKATLEEWQRGGSAMGGMAMSASIPLGNIQISGANSLGGAYSTSSGSRDLAAENVQRLGDSFAQASSAQRQLNSTVVIQARQEEKESIQTRTFTNYNHSHTLTVLYYEVLRHFKVTVEWVRRKPVLLKNVPAVNLAALGYEHILLYRPLIEPNLLDRSLAPAFDVIARLVAQQEFYRVQGIDPSRPVAHVYGEGGTVFSAFCFVTKSGNEKKESETRISAVVRDADGNPVRIHLLGSQGSDGPWSDVNLNKAQRFNSNQVMSFIVKPETGPFRWRQLIGFEIANSGKKDDWDLAELGIWGVASDSGLVALHQPAAESALQTVNLAFPEDDLASQFILIRPPGADPAQAERQRTPEQLLTPEELRLIAGLKKHLTAFSAQYQRLIYLSADPNENARNFILEDYGTTGSKLLDHVAPTPLELFGNQVAYELLQSGRVSEAFLTELFTAIHSVDPEQQQRAIGMLADLSEGDLEVVATRFVQRRAVGEKLITLPTRGVFAEGKLGRANLSEEIDNTRFWKWEEHPIPFEAPGINPVTPVSPQPQQTTIAPTAFPASLVNIVTPSPAPDPSGLGEVLKAFATPNLFRDMSGRSEVADLLKKLSDNTIGFQEAANKAREIQNKYGSDLAGVNRDSPASTQQTVADAIAAAQRQGATNNEQRSSKADDLAACRAAGEIAETLPPSQRKTLYPVIRDQVEKSLRGNPFNIVFTVNWGGIAARPGLGGLVKNATMQVTLQGDGKRAEAVDIVGGRGSWKAVEEALRVGSMTMTISPDLYGLPEMVDKQIHFPGGVVDGIEVPAAVLNRADKPLLQGAASYGVAVGKSAALVDLTARLSLKSIEFTATLSAGANIAVELGFKLAEALNLNGITTGIEFTPKIVGAVNVTAGLQVKYAVDIVTIDPLLGVVIAYV